MQTYEMNLAGTCGNTTEGGRNNGTNTRKIR